MTDRLPPETARRLITAHLDEARAHVQSRGYVTRDDSCPAFQAWWDAGCPGCTPDKVIETIRVSSSLDDILNGPGTYDHYERAGWVKRQPEPVDAPEWGEWVKLAVVGQRPDGVEFGDGERIRQRTHRGIEGEDDADATWKTVTHYRRKRILCVSIRENAGHWRSPFGPATKPPRAPGHYALRGSTWTPATTPEDIAAKAGRDPNGVIAWHGGECPVGDEARRIVHYRGGGSSTGLPLDVARWVHNGTDGDIIAYEVTNAE